MRTRNMFIVVGALAATAVVAVGVRAATSFGAPTTLGYSGTLLSGSSPAADGTYVLTFALHGTATGGTALWTETQTSVAAVGGRFSVVLGSTTPIPAAALNSKALWLGITVGSEVLSPRQPVSSVPFALRAPLQCRTVTTNSAAGGGAAAATAACDAAEIVTGGACINLGAGYNTYSQSFVDDVSYACLFVPSPTSSGTIFDPARAGQAQARCCKM